MIDWTPVAPAAIAAAPSRAKSADSGLTAADWAAMVSAGFAAIAGIASLIAVLQNKKIISVTLRPRLTGIVIGGGEPPSLRVHNAGGAVAIMVRVVWTNENRRAEGEATPGLASGEYATVVASLPCEKGLQDSHGVIIYKDVLGNFYANSLDGHSKDWRKRWWKKKLKPPDLHDGYEEFYGTSISEWESIELRATHRWSDALVVAPEKT